MNADLLRETWAEVLEYGDQPIRDLYAAVFLAAPGTNRLFSPDMNSQRAKIIDALDLVIQAADDLDAVVPVLQELGRAHVRFGVLPEHFPVVKRALLRILADYLGPAWTPEVEATWTAAIDLVMGVMLNAAHADADGAPPAWEVPILGIEPHGPSEATITVDPGPDYPWQPGQLVPLAIVGRRGSERPHIPQRHGDHTALAFHVSRNGDWTSLALLNSHPGALLRLGRPLPSEDHQ